jgi:hypothetical protein
MMKGIKQRITTLKTKKLKKKQREKEPWNKWRSHPLNLPFSQHQKTHL